MKYLLCTKFRTLIAYTYHCPGDGMLDHFNLQEVVLDGYKLNVIPNEKCSVENGCTDIWPCLFIPIAFSGHCSQFSHCVTDSNFRSLCRHN